jgi:hypothetical protein
MLSYPKGPKLFCHENTMDLNRHCAVIIFLFLMISCLSVLQVAYTTYKLKRPQLLILYL